LVDVGSVDVVAVESLQEPVSMVSLIVGRVKVCCTFESVDDA
jgi:hypothetical protein